MSILGETLSDSVELLISKLISDELLSFARQERFLADLHQWSNILRGINLVLKDAEEKQITDLVVKTWLADLKNLVYDVDEFASAALERKLSHQPAEASTSKLRRKVLSLPLRKLLPTCSANFKPHSINVKMRSKIKEITARLEVTASQKKDLDLRDPISVIPISMGGVGKKTLAQLVYNDKGNEDDGDIQIKKKGDDNDGDGDGDGRKAKGVQVVQAVFFILFYILHYLICLTNNCMGSAWGAEGLGHSLRGNVIRSDWEQVSSRFGDGNGDKDKGEDEDEDDDDIQNNKKGGDIDGDGDGDGRKAKGNVDDINGGGAAKWISRVNPDMVTIMRIMPDIQTGT